MAMHTVRLLAALAILTTAPATGLSQEGGDEDESVQTAVARALIDRGNALYRARDYENARELYIEALEKDPKGPHAPTALDLLRKANARLGRYRDDGRPKGAGVTEPKDTGGGDGDVIDPYGGGGGDGGGGDDVVDPYGGGEGGGDTGGGGDDVIDPYGGGGGDTGGGGGDVIDPYGGGGDTGGGGGGGGPIDEPPEEPGTDRGVRREFMTWGGAIGFVSGVGFTGAEQDGATLIGLLAGGAGIGLTWWAADRWTIEEGEAMAIESGGTWGAVQAAFLGHAFTGVDHDYDAEDGFLSAAIGGLIGTGAGTLWAIKGDPQPDDIAFANSMGLYGGAAGLLFGVALDPPEPEAYSVNAVVGSTAALAAGMYFSDRVDASRRRMFKVDVGAAVGAATPWALVYPLVKDDGTNNDEQAVGAISIATMAAGAYLTWRFTRDDSDGDDELPPDAAVPAVATRGSDGTWRLGAPIPRPMEDPSLAPRSGAFTLGVDLLGGRF